MSSPQPAAPAAAKTEDMKKKRMYQLIMAIAGTVLTQLAWNPTGLIAGYTNISNIIASAALGLIAGVLFKKHFDIFYAGTFAGMCSASVLPHWAWAFVLGGLVFVFWVLLEKKFIGVGGKFGTTAMVSGLATSLIVMIAVNATGGTYPNIWFVATNYAQLDGYLWVFGPILGALGCTATLYVRNKGELVKNTTVASAMIGLLGALCLLLINTKVPTSATVSYGAVLAGVVYTASFAGMASKERLDPCKVYSEYIAFAITGAIAGILFMGIYAFMLVGGRFGFIGFCSVLIYNKVICPQLRKMRARKAPAPAASA